MELEPRSRENVNGGGVGGGGMRGERVVGGEVEEAEDKVRIVAQLKGD